MSVIDTNSSVLSMTLNCLIVNPTLLTMALNSVPFANIDIESFFYECKTGNEVLAVLEELLQSAE